MYKPEPELELLDLVNKYGYSEMTTHLEHLLRMYAIALIQKRETALLGTVAGHRYET